MLFSAVNRSGLAAFVTPFAGFMLDKCLKILAVTEGGREVEGAQDFFTQRLSGKVAVL